MHPVLIPITENFFIATYGVLIAVGAMIAIWLAGWRMNRRGLPGEVAFDLALVCLVAGFLSARLAFIIVEWREFLASPMSLILSRSGFVFLGGFIGGAGAGLFYLHKKKLPILLISDALIPSLLIAHGFGRLGCHFAGCCFGGQCSIPALAIQVPARELPNGEPVYNVFLDQWYRGLIPEDQWVSLPVWPVQMYEALGLFALAAALLWFARRPRPMGILLAIYLIAYPLLRFGLEFLRGDEARGMFFGGVLSTSQILSLALLGVGTWLLVKVRNNPASAPPKAPPSALPKSSKQPWPR